MIKEQIRRLEQQIVGCRPLLDGQHLELLPCLGYQPQRLPPACAISSVGRSFALGGPSRRPLCRRGAWSAAGRSQIVERQPGAGAGHKTVSIWLNSLRSSPAALPFGSNSVTALARRSARARRPRATADPYVLREATGPQPPGVSIWSTPTTPRAADPSRSGNQEIPDISFQRWFFGAASLAFARMIQGAGSPKSSMVDAKRGQVRPALAACRRSAGCGSACCLPFRR
jgi:hypothetical protein